MKSNKSCCDFKVQSNQAMELNFFNEFDVEMKVPVLENKFNFSKFNQKEINLNFNNNELKNYSVYENELNQYFSDLLKNKLFFNVNCIDISNLSKPNSKDSFLIYFKSLILATQISLKKISPKLDSLSILEKRENDFVQFNIIKTSNLKSFLMDFNSKELKLYQVFLTDKFKELNEILLKQLEEKDIEKSKRVKLLKQIELITQDCLIKMK